MHLVVLTSEEITNIRTKISAIILNENNELEKITQITSLLKPQEIDCAYKSEQILEIITDSSDEDILKKSITAGYQELFKVLSEKISILQTSSSKRPRLGSSSSIPSLWDNSCCSDPRSRSSSFESLNDHHKIPYLPILNMYLAKNISEHNKKIKIDEHDCAAQQHDTDEVSEHEEEIIERRSCAEEGDNYSEISHQDDSYDESGYDTEHSCRLSI